jgi:hypothetical protein
MPPTGSSFAPSRSAMIRALQLPGRGDEQLEELLALSGLGHEFAHHAESSHHAFFR